MRNLFTKLMTSSMIVGAALTVAACHHTDTANTAERASEFMDRVDDALEPFRQRLGEGEATEVRQFVAGVVGQDAHIDHLLQERLHRRREGGRLDRGHDGPAGTDTGLRPVLHGPRFMAVTRYA